MSNENKKALIAMSGGVDSSVAAALMLKKGFDCMGCTMRLYENDMIGEDLFGTCCSLKDTQDARAVCDKLGIEYNIYHYEAEFTKNVIEPFVCSYERGETPNPCIRCNKYLKFDILYEKAKAEAVRMITDCWRFAREGTLSEEELRASLGNRSYLSGLDWEDPRNHSVPSLRPPEREDGDPA